ncbi:Ig-like domain-containing protein [Streptomyces sp. ISL-36]|uniref:Ig-like domain-containing protein n=1 Tax=Streptomyces sp. ISL-36 TaxID=2819182 RepID=UPI001BECD4F2|nr:Ig-like domain-containing protein [Streptomyces sp. ISL-36]MBT2440078.1 Ig-like domain-containing protein [Streptomyces sp. ISL-36]
MMKRLMVRLQGPALCAAAAVLAGVAAPSAAAAAVAHPPAHQHHREATVLYTGQAHIDPLGGMQISGLYASLNDANGNPVVGRLIQFYAQDGTLLAMARTNADGKVYTTAPANIGTQAVSNILAGGYAVFHGDDHYTASNGSFGISPVGTAKFGFY